MKSTQPTILVVNDDGITAPGIKALMDAMTELGRVVVVAPDSPQSGMGHAITIGKPLRLDKVDIYDGIEMYRCSGTPVDCVKLAVNVIFKGKKPDLIAINLRRNDEMKLRDLFGSVSSTATVRA